MRIGTMFLGKVDTLDEESVQTKFFVLGVPLFPISSTYVVKEEGRGVKGFEIPLSGKSVLFGYLRMYAWLAALLLGIFAYAEHTGALWGWSAVAAVVAAVVSFGMGGLSKEERLRRMLLQKLSGVGAPPELLPADSRADTAKQLEAAWEGKKAGEWRSAIEQDRPDPLLFALAEYSSEPALARRAMLCLLTRSAGAVAPAPG